MKRTLLLSIAVCMFTANIASADTFGTGANQIEIDFVPISGDSGDLGSWSAGSNYTFSGVNHGDYRMGTYEITNSQWDKFKTAYGTVTGSPSNAYDESPYFAGMNVPTNKESWYEATQFVNWLNTSTGNPAAYKFTGTQGTSGYTLGVWESGDAGYNPSNPYRNSNAFYFIPTEDEWIKAAYWNGTSLQTYATKDDDTPIHRSDAPSGTGWNYFGGDISTQYDPWDVGSGSEELNGTYDMMGNVYEWVESPYFSGNYSSGSGRGIRGGYSNTGLSDLTSSFRGSLSPNIEGSVVGFRVASVPEPTTLLLLGLGGIALHKRR